MSRAEKFIEDCTRGCSNELCAVEDKYGKKVISYHEWLTPEQALRAVEIERKELIEKESAMGNGLVCDVDVDWWEDKGQYKASVHIGEEYYESDPYKSPDLALCEVKGWLEGVKVKIDSQLKALETL